MARRGFATPVEEISLAMRIGLYQIEAGQSVRQYANPTIANAFFAVLKKHGITKDNRTGYPIGVSYPPDGGERAIRFASKASPAQLAPIPRRECRHCPARSHRADG